MAKVISTILIAAVLALGGVPAPDAFAGRKLTSAESYVVVKPFAISIIERNHIKGIFVVEFGIDVPDGELRAHAEEILPRLRDLWLRTLSYYGQTMVHTDRQADIESLVSRLQTATDEALGQKGARILIMQAVVRKRI